MSKKRMIREACAKDNFDSNKVRISVTSEPCNVTFKIAFQSIEIPSLKVTETIEIGGYINNDHHFLLLSRSRDICQMVDVYRDPKPSDLVHHNPALREAAKQGYRDRSKHNGKVL